MNTICNKLNNLNIRKKRKRSEYDIYLNDIEEFLTITKNQYEKPIIKQKFKKIVLNIHPDKDNYYDISLFCQVVKYYKYLTE